MSSERRLPLIGAAILGALAFPISANSAPPLGPGSVSSFAILSTDSRVIMGNAARVVSQPGNIGGTTIRAGRGSSFSKDLIAPTAAGKAITLGRATSVQGKCVSGGGAIDLRPVSECTAGQDSSGASPLLQIMSDATQDATDFASALRSYSPTQTLDAPIKVKAARTETITLTPDFNVVDIPAVSVGRGASLILEGASTASAVIRLAGDLTLRNTARLDLRDGIDSRHVVILVQGSAARLANKSSLSGTLFASDGVCKLGNDVSLTGSLICRGKIRMGNGDLVSVNPVALNLLTAKLYVMDSPLLSAPNVREYPNPDPIGGDISPIAVLGGPATALLSPFFIALDRNGSAKVYVTNPNSGSLPHSINVYSQPINGDHAPKVFIFGSHTGLSNPAGVSLDSANNIYVANSAGNRITVYPAGSHGDQSPLFTIEGSHTGLSSPVGLALDRDENIWVVNNAAPISLTKYQNGLCATGSTCDQLPAAVVSNPALSGPTDLAFDHRGDIWVTNSPGSSSDGINSLLKFSPSGTLLATIAGAQTTLNLPFGIAIDGAGSVLVANYQGASIVGFRTDACTSADTEPCDIEPDFILAGPNSKLDQPAGLALGP